MLQESAPDRKPDPIHPQDGVAPAAGEIVVQPRSIFRSQAIDNYVRNQDRAVFPSLVSPRIFRLLWILAAGSMMLGIIIAFWPVLAPLLDGLP